MLSAFDCGLLPVPVLHVSQCFPALRVSLLLLCIGILYTARPRGDITGTARFVDMRNRLCCEVDFGKQSGAEDRLLQRSDALSGSLYSFISEPKNASHAGLVSHSAIICPLVWTFVYILAVVLAEWHDKVGSQGIVSSLVPC